MSVTLTCPVCRTNVSGTSSMCLSCHLPIQDVRANQHLVNRRRSKLALLLVLLLSLVLAGVIGLRLRDDSPLGNDRPHDRTPAGQEVVYSKLDVVQSQGRFSGTIELTNPTDVHANVLLQVHVYDGEQEIGELSGDVTLKPHSTAVADLQSFDKFRSFDDSVVELIALPAAVN